MTKAKKEWIETAVAALDKAYVPYSKFPVGACLVTKRNHLSRHQYRKCFVWLNELRGTHRIFQSNFRRRKDFQHLVVAGHTPEPISPCGACRQVMVEFCQPDMPVTLVGDDGIIKETTVEGLLPYYFTNKDL